MTLPCAGVSFQGTSTRKITAPAHNTTTVASEVCVAVQRGAGLGHVPAVGLPHSDRAGWPPRIENRCQREISTEQGWWAEPPPPASPPASRASRRAMSPSQGSTPLPAALNQAFLFNHNCTPWRALHAPCLGVSGVTKRKLEQGPQRAVHGGHSVPNARRVGRPCRDACRLAVARIAG